MSYYQHPSLAFDLSREHHNQLLQEAAQRQLLNPVKGRTTPSTSIFLLWLRGHKPAPTIGELPLMITPTVN